jgi:glucose-1-phosphate adenylyltransferase
MKQLPTIVLAGGRGERMDILCYVRPKPVLPFAGKYRVIDFTLSNCVHSEIRNISVAIDYQRTMMASYLRRWSMVNALSSRITILEPKKGSYLGTADAVFKNLNYLRNRDIDAILVLAGDHIYKMDYRNMLDFHKQVKADATVAAVTIPIKQTNRFGIITADEEGRVTDFIEKPSNPRNGLISMGIYIFNVDILFKRLAEDAARDSTHDFGHAILPRMVKEDKVYAYKYKDYWRDIGTPKAYYNANMDFLTQYPAFSLNDSWPIFTVPSHLSLPRISDQGTAENSLISPGCLIKGYVKNSVLSPGVHVEEKAVVENSVLMANTFIGYHSVVQNSILDEGINLGKFCYIGFGKSHTSGKPAVTLLGKEVTVPPGTAVCVNCTVPAYTTPDDFPSNFVRESILMK